MEASMDTTDYNDPSLTGHTFNAAWKNPLDELPMEVSLRIFSLAQSNLHHCSLVCRQWNALANDKDLIGLWKLPENAFGAKQWEECFGLVIERESVPSLPSAIYKILKSQCPFSTNGEKVEDTHLLVLIPGSINGKPLTLKTFGEFVKIKFHEFGRCGFQRLWEAEECEGNNEHYWVLMTKDILSSSRKKSFTVQQQQIEEDGQGNYQVPKILEMVVCAITEYARSGGKARLFSDNPWTYARCQEKIGGLQVAVGGFGTTGLYIFLSRLNCRIIGVAALRKFGTMKRKADSHLVEKGVKKIKLE